MKVRIRFSKYGVIRFIGHLDVMRSFQKNFRRAGIDVEYSKGFSPHQLMSFSAPLGVGITSDGEYLDLSINSYTDKYDMMKRINDTSVDGIEITDIILLNDKAKNSMSIVKGAGYYVKIRQEEYEEKSNPPSKQEFYAKFSEFLANEKIEVLKKTKKSEAIVDIRPLIFEYDCIEDTSAINSQSFQVDDNGICVYLLLSTGSNDNLSPKLVMDAFCKYAGYDFDEYTFAYHRTQMYSRDEEGNLIALSEVDKNSEQTDFYQKK